MNLVQGRSPKTVSQNAQVAVPLTINRSNRATPPTRTTPPNRTPPQRTNPSLPIQQKTSPTTTGQKRPRQSTMIDLTDDEPGNSSKRVSVSLPSPVGSSVPNGSIRNSESVQNRNCRQRYRDSSVVPKDSAMVTTIIGSIKLPTPPQPPKFEKQAIPHDVKSLPRKLKIEANFEGKNNMKVRRVYISRGRGDRVQIWLDQYY